MQKSMDIREEFNQTKFYDLVARNFVKIDDFMLFFCFQGDGRFFFRVWEEL